MDVLDVFAGSAAFPDGAAGFWDAVAAPAPFVTLAAPAAGGAGLGPGLAVEEGTAAGTWGEVLVLVDATPMLRA